MPKVMPVAIRDETGAFIRQMAQGNEALARLYAQLLARYEERRMNEEFQREMFDKQTQRQKDYFDYTQGPQVGDPNTDHPFGSRGAPPNANPPSTPPAAAPTAPARPAARPMPMIPGAAPIPGGDSFTSGSNAPAPSPTPVATPAGFTPITPGYDSFAQAPRSADHQEFSAQSRIGQPAPPPRVPRANARSVAPPPGQLPRGTGMDPPRRTTRTRQPPATAEFLPIQQEWLEKMSAAEKKYNVPQGSVLAVYGFENAGGRVLGKNSKSSAAGIGQFTEGLMKEYKLDPALRNDPNVMIDLIARNMRRNADVLEKHYKVKLEPNSEMMPMFTLMHQLGVTDGPRVVKTLLENPDVPMTQIMANINGRNNAQVLVNNGIPSNATVRKVFEQHSSLVRPWYDNGLKLMTGVTGTQPSSQTQPSQPSTQAGVAAPTTTATQAATPPTPPANIPAPATTTQAHTENVGPLTAIRKGPSPWAVKPHVQNIIDEFQQRYPTARVTSGYRGNRAASQHANRVAFDFSLKGMPDAQRAEAINFLRSKGAVGIGNYGGDSFHADLRTGWPNVAWGPNRSHTSLGRTPGWFQQIAQQHRGGQRPDAMSAAAKPAPVAAPAPAPAPNLPVQNAATAPPGMRPIKPSEADFKTAATTNVGGGMMFGAPASDPLTTDPNARRLAAFGDVWQAPPIPRITPQQGGAPIAAGPGGLAARSALDYEPPPPSIAPQASGVAARSDLDYNAPPPPAQREAPDVGPYEAAPEAPAQREDPEVGPYEAPPTPSPLQAPLQPLAPEMAGADAVPQSQTEFEWPGEGMPQSPNIAGPPISISGGPPNAPTPQDVYPPPEFNQIAETSHNYNPNSRAGRRIDAARNQPPAMPRDGIYDQLVRSIAEGGNIAPRPPVGDPAAAQATPAPPQPPQARPTLNDIAKAIYGSQGAPIRTGRGAAEVEFARKADAARAQRNAEAAQVDNTIPPEQRPSWAQPPVASTAPQAPMPVLQGDPEYTSMLQRMKDIILQSVKEGTRQPTGPNPIEGAVRDFVRRQQEARPAGGSVKTQQYGSDWMPKTPPPPPPTSSTKSSDRVIDDLPPPPSPLVVPPRGGSRQQPTAMPNMAPKTMPAGPQAGGGASAGPQVMGGEARKQAAMNAVQPGEQYEWLNDNNVQEYGIRE